MFNEGLLLAKSFSVRANVWKKTAFFRATNSEDHRRPHCKQDNVFYYLALQSEAFVIILQETHCTNAEKLVLSSYHIAESSLSRKQGLATFVHERPKYTLLDQSPLTLEIKWLCVDVDGYKIVNVYKPPPT